MESSFSVINRIISEPSNSYDELRIIAKDEKRLSRSDRDCLIDAAENIERLQGALIETSKKLIETEQKLSAVNDQLADANKKISPEKYRTFPNMSARSGPIPMVSRSVLDIR